MNVKLLTVKPTASWPFAGRLTAAAISRLGNAALPFALPAFVLLAWQVAAESACGASHWDLPSGPPAACCSALRSASPKRWMTISAPPSRRWHKFHRWAGCRF
jgi:hypothetical protein